MKKHHKMTQCQISKTNLIIQMILREFLLFIIGGLIYASLEVFTRGFTHWSMFIVGGLCFVIIGLLNEWYNEHTLFELQTVIGAFVITALEFISGYIVNIKLGWNVWDYSQHNFNLFGQICLHHTICYWIPLSAVAIALDDILRDVWFNEPFPKYRFILSKHK